MMAVKQMVLLLLLGAVVSSAETEECDALIKPLPTTQLDKIFGDWVMVWGVGDTAATTEVVTNTTSNDLVFGLLADNKTVTFHEGNVYQTNTSSCNTVRINLTVNADSEHLKMQTTDMLVDVDGVRQEYNDSGELDFYETCEGCMTFVYTERVGRFLQSYRREGSHRDMDQMKAAHDQLKKVAECLKFPTDQQFVYDGVSDFCHKKSAPEVKAEEA